MVLLLNLLLPVWIVILGSLAYRLKKIWPVVVMLVGLFVYTAALPSYMPKGEIKRTQPPAFEYKELTVQDRLSKPPTKEESEASLKRKMGEGVPFSLDKLTEQ